MYAKVSKHLIKLIQLCFIYLKKISIRLVVYTRSEGQIDISTSSLFKCILLCVKRKTVVMEGKLSTLLSVIENSGPVLLS